jgi:hypothetical protein
MFDRGAAVFLVCASSSSLRRFTLSFISASITLSSSCSSLRFSCDPFR